MICSRNNNIKQLIRSRDLKYKEYSEGLKINNNIESLRNEYRILRYKVVFEMKKAKKTYYSNLIERNSNKPKKLWNTISKIITTEGN